MKYIEVISCFTCPCFSDCCAPHCGLDAHITFDLFTINSISPDCPLNENQITIQRKYSKAGGICLTGDSATCFEEADEK